MSVASRPGWGALALFASLVATCAAPEVTTPGSKPSPGPSAPGGATDPGGGSARPQPGGGGGGSFTLPDAGPAAPKPVTGVDDKDRKCAEDVQQARQTPVDLLLLVDSSGSMDNPQPRTKWIMVRDALTGFVKDTRSSGLGVGLQFFPELNTHGCMADVECGGTNTRAVLFCQKPRACAVKGVDAGKAQACSVLLSPCKSGVTCALVGRCSVSGAACFVGQPCPGGMAGDTCTDMPGKCITDITSCEAADYQKAAVAIAELPGSQGRLMDALVMRKPGGGTPMGAAVEGGLKQLQAHLAAHPGRRGVLVLATDGVPDGCPDDAAEPINARLAAARAADPSISTYVIGVFSSVDQMKARPVLDGLATAGGTGMPFVLTPTDDLTQKFQEALEQIRGRALACEFDIPPPRTGTIDYKKVNVSFQTAAGTEEVLYAGTEARCDPMKGGWYYDVDPATGAKPSRVIVCPATCQRFKAEPTASVQLRFGCGTNYIP
jgi:hypothetical protein